MIQFLEDMLKSYSESISEFGEQSTDIRREAAKDRALECILHSKVLSSKILGEIFTTVTGEDAAGFDTYRSTDADTVEQMLVGKYENEGFKKDLQISNLKKQIEEVDN